jgi:hypothetical protein
MYIFSFDFFDDFQKRKFKIIKIFKTKNVHVANESCCKYEKISMKNTFYFSHSKKDKFSKILESFDRSRWMKNMSQIRAPVTT